MKTPRAKTPKLKRREQATPARRHRSSAADLQKQLDQRTRELAEARKNLAEAHEQQRATSEVLRVISSSSGELAPVFESLLASAKHLCGAEFGIILLREGDAFRTVALHGATAEYTELRLFDEVQARTRELSQSIGELRALGEVSQAVNSTLDLPRVLDTIVAKATQLSAT